MIQIILNDIRLKRKKYQSPDHEPKNPHKDVHNLKNEIIKEVHHSGISGKKEMEKFGTNCDLGILDGKIVLISKKYPGKTFDTGLNATDFFTLLSIMLFDFSIYHEESKKNISVSELYRIINNWDREEKLKRLNSLFNGDSQENDEENTQDNMYGRIIFFEVKTNDSI